MTTPWRTRGAELPRPRGCVSALRLQGSHRLRVGSSSKASTRVCTDRCARTQTHMHTDAHTHSRAPMQHVQHTCFIWCSVCSHKKNRRKPSNIQIKHTNSHSDPLRGHDTEERGQRTEKGTGMSAPVGRLADDFRSPNHRLLVGKRVWHPFPS